MMKSLVNWIFCVILIIGICAAFPKTETLQTIDASERNVACYQMNDYFQPSCPNDTVIAVKDIKVGAKKTSLSCNTGYKTFNSHCCMPDLTDDCIITYSYNQSNLDVTQKFHRKCSGYQTCTGTSPAPRDTTTVHCNNSINCPGLNCEDMFMDFTNYFYMEYACVTKSRTQSFDVNSFSGNGLPVYLHTPNYPENFTTSNDYGRKCHVTSDANQITMYTLDIRLQNAPGECQTLPTVTVSDGRVTWYPVCNDSVDYPFTVQERVFGSSLDVTFNRIGSGNYNGLLWIAFEGGNLQVECQDVDKDNRTDDNKNETSKGQNGDDGTGVGAIAGGVVGALLFLVLLFVLIFCLIKRKNKKNKTDANQNETSKDDKPVEQRTTAPIPAMFDVARNEAFNKGRLPPLAAPPTRHITEHDASLGINPIIANGVPNGNVKTEDKVHKERKKKKKKKKHRRNKVDTERGNENDVKMDDSKNANLV